MSIRTAIAGALTDERVLREQDFYAPKGINAVDKVVRSIKADGEGDRELETVVMLHLAQAGVNPATVEKARAFLAGLRSKNVVVVHDKITV